MAFPSGLPANLNVDDVASGWRVLGVIDGAGSAYALEWAGEDTVQATVPAGTNVNQPATLALSTPIDFVGDPKRVEISVNVHAAIPDNVARARPAAVLELYRGATLLATMATGYIRDTNDHEEASWHCHYVDVAPGVDPVYTIETRSDSTITGAVDSIAPSTVSAIAKF